VKSFLSFAAAAYSRLLCELLGKYLLVSELHIAHVVRQVFFPLQFSAAESWMPVLAWQFVHAVHENDDFLKTYLRR